MERTSAEWMVLVLWFVLSILLHGSVEMVEAEAEAAGLIHVSLHPNANLSDWTNVVLQSKNRANALISRLHGASSNGNSTYMQRRLSTSSANVPVVSGNSDGSNYIVNVGFGTPPNQNIKMNFDTSSDVSWLRCDYSARSSSYKRLDCKSCYRQVEGVACNSQNQCILQAQYMNGEQVMAYMSQDTLSLGSQSFPNFGFGCGYNFNGFKGRNPSVGLLALGRNSLSLPSQIRTRVFSYCLPDFLIPQPKGSLKLGDAGSIPSTSKFTALLSNPEASSWYFVGISGISVGGIVLNIPPNSFQFNSRGGGTMVDSGIVISQLVQPAYDALRAALLKQMKLSLVKAQLPLDTCFGYSGDIADLQIPAVTFHFQDGLNLPINRNGILTAVSEDAICLAFQPMASNDLNIIGALQQQGYIISFDEDRKRIGFAPVSTCT